MIAKKNPTMRGRRWTVSSRIGCENEQVIAIDQIEPVLTCEIDIAEDHVADEECLYVEKLLVLGEMS